MVTWNRLPRTFSKDGDSTTSVEACSIVWLASPGKKKKSLFLNSSEISHASVCVHFLFYSRSAPLRSLSPYFSFSPYRYLYEITLSRLLSSLNGPSSQSLLLHASVPPSPLWPCTGLTLVSPYLSWSGELSTGPSNLGVTSAVLRTGKGATPFTHR